VFEPEAGEPETLDSAAVDSFAQRDVSARVDTRAPVDAIGLGFDVETEAAPAIAQNEPPGSSQEFLKEVPIAETEPTRTEAPVLTRADVATREDVEKDVDGSGPDTTYVPFQPVWEVDVFDVPTPVADLFFEGALFQQIAERMSEAVGSGLRTVLVTSASPGEGRSSVAIGTAMAAAAAGIRVALVDADTESPTLADELRLELQYGWVDVIRQGLPIKEIAVQAIEDGVTLIPLMPPGVRQAATAFEMVQLIDLLKSNFELIILDGPTSLSRGLQPCASKVDSAIIVRDVTQSNEAAVAELARSLQAAGVRGVGVVENFV
jgi:Mrp family chromosome partitioning ATPase